MIYSSVAVDLMQPNNMTLLHATQGDSGRGIYVYLTANGQQIPSGHLTSASLYVRRPDGVVKKVGCELIQNQNYVRVGILPAMLELDGMCAVAIRAVVDNVVITSPPFRMEVHENVAIEGTSPEFVIIIRKPSDEIPVDDEEGGSSDPLIGG